jgi:hypothetical protein
MFDVLVFGVLSKTIFEASIEEVVFVFAASNVKKNAVSK